MKKLFLTTLVIALFAMQVFNQNLTQTVRGTIIDIDSKLSLIGASILIVGTNPAIGTTTDANGKFRLEKVSIGRVTLQFSYIGYEPLTVTNIEVNSGKEVVLDLNMKESTVKMEAVVVKPNHKKGEALNG
jgi:hypothetical protein